MAKLGNTQYEIVLHDRKTTSPKFYMTCPSCGSRVTTVEHTAAAYNQSNGMSGIGRVRECYHCKYTFRTLEVSY